MTVNFRQWLSQSISDIRSSDQPFSARFLRPLYYVYVGGLLSITKRYPYGTNVFDRNWDTLIILDACRVDALQAVADEYDYLNEVDMMTSVGSTSFEWMNHTFSRDYVDEIRRTGYITGNAYTDRVLGEGGDTGHAAMPFGPTEYDVVGPDDFGYLEELWGSEFDDDSPWIIGSSDTTRRSPRYTTDRAITAGRTVDTDRLMIHYMYPHDPFPLADDLFRPFDALRSGDVSRKEVWDLYLDNLRLVLDEVELLLDNLDSETVAITADHGEAFGEYGFYRHVIGCPLSSMRKVPWVQTTAKDTGEYDPSASNPKSEMESDVESRLEDLGYL